MREPLKNVKLRYLLKEYELEFAVWVETTVDYIEVIYDNCAVNYASTAYLFFIDNMQYLRKFEAFKVEEKQDEK